MRYRATARRSPAGARLVAASLLAMLIAGMGQAEASKALSAPPPVRYAFTLGDEELAIWLPAGAVLRSAPGAPAYFDLTKGGRLQRTLHIALAEGPREVTERTLSLANGGRLEFAVAADTGGGSGGPIAELRGRLRLGPLQLAVECTDQGELRRDAEWCLPYLERLEIVGRRK